MPPPRRIKTMEAPAPVKPFYIVLALSALGAILKSIAFLEGSRAALVDAMTCVANLAAGIVVAYALRMAARPPDRDHPYGHRRFEIAAVLWTTVIYSIVAGATLAEVVVLGTAHEVRETAPLYTALGTLLYAAAILMARRLGLAGRAYAAFTFTEVYEGVAVTLAALGGTLVSTLVDYAGAIGLLAYLFYELYEQVASLTSIVTERVPPELLNEVKTLLESHGLRVESLRLRPFLPGEYIGDAVVRLTASTLHDAHSVIDRVEKELLRRRITLVIHYEPVGRDAR